MDFNFLEFTFFLFLLILALFIFGFILYFSFTILLDSLLIRGNKKIKEDKEIENEYNFIHRVITNKTGYQQYDYQNFYRVFIKLFPESKDIESFILFLFSRNIYNISYEQKKSKTKLNKTLGNIIEYYKVNNAPDILVSLLHDIFFWTVTISNHGGLEEIESIINNNDSLTYITKFYGNNPTNDEILTKKEFLLAS